jgi:putative addiction module killer protein
MAAMQFIVRQVEDFAKWRHSIRDLRAATAIRRRLERAEAGNLGDVKSVGGGVSEMRIDIGPGYRIYFTVRERVVLFLLAGGNKSTQSADIRRAIEIAKDI